MAVFAQTLWAKTPSDFKYRISTAHFQRHRVHPVGFYESALHKIQHCESLSVSWQVNCQPAFDLGPEPVRHIYLFTFVWHSTEGSAAGVWPLTDRTRTFQSSRIRLFWLSSLSSFAYITLAVMDRCPGCSWYGKLDILWFVKRFFFVLMMSALFYSWVSV